MPDGDLRHLAEVEEISIGFTRPDGSVGSTPVWVVQADDAVFVRSIRGRRGGCRFSRFSARAISAFVRECTGARASG
jgi:hypothetical protein